MHLIKHFFLPTATNRFQAVIVRPQWLLFSLLISISLSLLALNHPSSPIKGTTTDLSADQVIALTNQRRQSLNLPRLVPNPLLTQAANNKAQHMLATGKFEHYYTNDGHEITPWQFILDTGYSFHYAGENLARGFTSTDTLIDSWIQSPSHQANLLSPNYTEIGVAVIEGSFPKQGPTTLVVQILASPPPADRLLEAGEYHQNFTTTSLLSASTPTLSFHFDSSFSLLTLSLLIISITIFTFIIDQTRGQKLRRTHLPSHLWHH